MQDAGAQTISTLLLKLAAETPGATDQKHQHPATVKPAPLVYSRMFDQGAIQRYFDQRFGGIPASLTRDALAQMFNIADVVGMLQNKDLIESFTKHMQFLNGLRTSTNRQDVPSVINLAPSALTSSGAVVNIDEWLKSAKDPDALYKQYETLLGQVGKAQAALRDVSATVPVVNAIHQSALRYVLPGLRSFTIDPTASLTNSRYQIIDPDTQRLKEVSFEDALAGHSQLTSFVLSRVLSDKRLSAEQRDRLLKMYYASDDEFFLNKAIDVLAHKLEGHQSMKGWSYDQRKAAVEAFFEREIVNALKDRAAPQIQKILSAVDQLSVSKDAESHFMSWLTSSWETIAAPVGLLLLLFGGNIGSILGALALGASGIGLFQRYQNLTSPASSVVLKDFLNTVSSGGVLLSDAMNQMIQKYGQGYSQVLRDFIFAAKMGFVKNYVLNEAEKTQTDILLSMLPADAIRRLYETTQQTGTIVK